MQNTPPVDEYYLSHWIEDPPWARASVMRVFDLSSEELLLAELGTHLKKNYSDVYTLSPRRFEELVADVFSDDEWEAHLTQQTNDGGLDVFLRSKRTGEIGAVVEVKRYAQTRRVGIEIVQRIAGVAVEWDARQAYVVTSSEFTRPARAAADRISAAGQVGIDLVAATEFAQLLGGYNAQLPPLDRLTPRIRAEIIRANREHSQES